jgi:hypothetical protein
MVDEIQGFADTMTNLINTLKEMAAGSREITDSIITLNSLSGGVKQSHSDMLEKTTALENAMQEISVLSQTS